MYYIMHFKKNSHPSPNTPLPSQKHTTKKPFNKINIYRPWPTLATTISAGNCLQDFAVDIDEEFMDISMASEDLMFLGWQLSRVAS